MPPKCWLFVAGISLCAACASDDNGPTTLDSGVIGAGSEAGITPPGQDAAAALPVGDASTTAPLDSSVAIVDSSALQVDGSSVHSDATVADAAPSATDGGGSDAAQGGGDAGGSSQTSVSGMLGALGPVKPIVNAYYISNSGETLVYMATAPISCQLLTMSRWLGSVMAGSQVVEVVIKGAPKVGTAVNVGLFGGEVNYAAGGKSSAYEVTASSGSITFTKSEPMSVVEGTFNATYPMGNVMGTFHAEFCPGGQGY